MRQLHASRRSVLTVGITLAATALLSGATFLVARGQYDAVHDAAYDSLEAIGRLRADQVTAWQDERIGDVISAAGSPWVADAVARWQTDPDNAQLRAPIDQQLALMLEEDQYENVLLLDLDGRLLASAHAEHAAVPPSTIALVDRVAAPGAPSASTTVILTDEASSIHADVAAAIRDRAGAPLAVLVLRSSPTATLYPRLKAWPGVSETGETTVLVRNGDQVLFLSVPRLADATPPRTYPLSRVDLPAVQAVLGRTGRFEGRDYREHEVLADLRPVPGMDWFLVTKVDVAEVEIVALTRAGEIGLLAALAVLLVGGLAVLAFLARRQSMQRRLLETERERAGAVQRFHHLFVRARDALLLLDPTGRIVEANVAAETMYGYSREDLLGMYAPDLRTPESRVLTEHNWATSRTADGVLFETVHQRRDGTAVPVEVSSRVIEIDGQPYRQSIIRDITLRKAGEDAMREQLGELQRWNAVTVGREHRIIGLKREVNELLVIQGRPPRYGAGSADGGEGGDA